MSDTLIRDQGASLAKSNPEKAIAKARSIKEPWFRAQALAYVARFSQTKGIELAAEAASTARKCDDAYKRVAVRACEIAALAEGRNTRHARKSLASALKDSLAIESFPSRAEALMLLLQAAVLVGPKERDHVHAALKEACVTDTHWRSKRALRDAESICNGSQKARPFFW